jgi:hypothetical protein
MTAKFYILTPKKFQGHFGEYWASNMYLLTCEAMIKMK